MSFVRRIAVAATLTAVTTFAAPAPVLAAAKVTSVPLAEGLYQSAYSERHDVLWVAASVGTPPAPVTSSALLRVDPRTLRVLSRHAARVPDAATGAIEAVYGLDVDEDNDAVWASATRADAVAVYDAATGAHRATLPNVPHSREVLVDERRDTVWISSVSTGTLVAFDTVTYAEKERVTIAGTRPTGLALNERTGTIYAADHGGGRLIEVSADGERTRLLPAGASPISVALSADGRTAYTADQAAGTLSVVDLVAGSVTAAVPTGSGPQSVRRDDRTGRLLIANRLAGTLSIVDPCTRTVVETVTLGAFLDHVEIVRGTAFVTDKSRGGPAAEDSLHRIRVSRS